MTGDVYMTRDEIPVVAKNKSAKNNEYIKRKQNIKKTYHFKREGNGSLQQTKKNFYKHRKRIKILRIPERCAGAFVGNKIFSFFILICCV